MTSHICRTCGCSLVRLGITNDQATVHSHNGEDQFFCCQGCLELFVADPPRYLEETSDLIVCPSCLAEKPRKWASKVMINAQEVFFCRCPYCPELFQKNPDYYQKRLEGTIPFDGVVGHEGCSTRPI